MTSETTPQQLFEEKETKFSLNRDDYNRRQTELSTLSQKKNDRQDSQSQISQNESNIIKLIRTKLTFFWWFCFIFTLIGIGILIYIVVRSVIGMDSRELHLSYGVGYPLFLLTICTGTLTVKHYIKWKPENKAVNFNLWNWSSCLVGSLESWTLLSFMLLSTLSLVKENTILTQKGYRKHSVVLDYGMYGELGMLVILLVLHIMIIYHFKPALQEHHYKIKGRPRHDDNKLQSTCSKICDGVMYWFRMVIFTNLFPYRLFFTPHKHVLDSGVGNIHSTNLSQSLLSVSANDEDEKNQDENVLINRQISTGWIVFTWLLFVMQCYLISSELIGYQEIGLTKDSRTVLLDFTLTIHSIVMLVTIRLCQLYKDKFKKYTKNSGFNKIFIPIFMAFFSVFHRFFWVVTGLVYILGPKYVTDGVYNSGDSESTYNTFKVEKAFWPFYILNVLIEILAMYYIFDIVFLKPVPKIMDKLDIKSSNALLHIYHSIVAYGILSVFMSSLIIVLNENLYYQFLISFEYCTFGQIAYDKDSNNESTAQTTKEVSAAISYYIIGLVLILVLGRSNRISFLWRSVASIADTLKEQTAIVKDLASNKLRQNAIIPIEPNKKSSSPVDDNHSNNDSQHSQRSLTGLWKVMILTAMCLCVFFGSRVFSSISDLEYILMAAYIGLALPFVCISLKLFYNVYKRHISKNETFWSFNYKLSRSEWMFVISCILTGIYHVILAVYQVDEKGISYQMMHGFFCVAALCEAVIGTNYYYKLHKLEITFIVILNIVFFIYVIAADLEEQLIISSENSNTLNTCFGHPSSNNTQTIAEVFTFLTTSSPEAGESENTPKWSMISSALFFANGEVFWGMMEAAQHAMKKRNNRLHSV